MVKPKNEPKTTPDAAPLDAAPAEAGSAAEDENAGLAARLLELRSVVEDHRRLAQRETGEQRTQIARIEERVRTLGEKVDRAMGDWDRRSRELDQTQRDAGEQVRRAGELARSMQDRVKVLDELRAVASDPHEVIKPVRRELAQLGADLQALAKRIDLKFEALPKRRAEAVESRDELGELRGEVKQLKRQLEQRG